MPRPAPPAGFINPFACHPTSFPPGAPPILPPVAVEPVILSPEPDLRVPPSLTTTTTTTSTPHLAPRVESPPRSPSPIPRPPQILLGELENGRKVDTTTPPPTIAFVGLGFWVRQAILGGLRRHI